LASVLIPATVKDLDTFYCAGVVLDPAAPQSVQRISKSLRIDLR
jgi:hypothetical protein